MTKVAIVTVDYNDHKDTREFLDSAKNLDQDGLEVLWLVVDNGSDTPVNEIIDNHPDVIWLQTGQNLGFTGGFNRGMEYAREWGADYLLIINNDTLFGDKLLIKKMLQVLQENPGSGIVSPKIYFAPGYEFHKSRYTKKDKGKVIWYAGAGFDWDNVMTVHRGIDEVDSGKYDQAEKISFSTACCLLVKREILDKVGYFDEKLFCYFDDVDWVHRINLAGYSQWYAGNTYIYHKASRTAGIGSPFTDYLHTRNRLWFGLKYAPAKTKLALLREAGRMLLAGRSAQKDGVLDYSRGIWGWKEAKKVPDVSFPLELSVVIVNYKTTDLLVRLLKSIYDPKSGFGRIRGGGEVIVLDNSPDQPCKEAVLSAFPQIKFISNSVNNGFSAGYNQLIHYSLGKYLLLLNSDIGFKPGGITELLKAVNEMGDRAVYTGKLYFSTGEEQDSCFNLPTVGRAFSQYFMNQPGSYFMFTPKGTRPVKVEGSVMACFLIPRRVINEVGELSEETFMYFEDIDYCRRCRSKGVPVYFVPGAKFIHHHGQASKQAGLDISNRRLVQAAKWYHGWLKYHLLTLVLWAGQKFGRVTTPVSRWKAETD
jgi:GT2 family glycosyltransferase